MKTCSLPQDLLRDVDRSFADTPLVAELCNDGRRTLALLFLLVLCLHVERGICNLGQLVCRLPEELAAIIQPQHVVEYIHTHLPRADPQTDSFTIFAFDEVLTAAAVHVRDF